MKTGFDNSGSHLPELEDEEWSWTLAYLTDILSHLSELDESLQRKDHLIFNMASVASTFQKENSACSVCSLNVATQHIFQPVETLSRS